MTVAGPSPVDAERAQVYAAERAAFGGTLHERQRPFEELDQRLRAVIGSAWWPGPEVVLRAARADARRSSAVERSRPVARGRGSGVAVEIRLAVGQLDEATLAHELAHVLAGVRSGHDERFRAAHVDVSQVMLGEIAAGWLRAAYLDHGLGLGRRAWPAPEPTGVPGLGPIAL
jgi:hypothetical protein